MQKFLTVMTGLLTLSACAGDVKYEYPERVDKRYERPTEYKQEDRLFGADTLKFTLGGEKEKKQEKQTAKMAAKSLWQAGTFQGRNIFVFRRFPLF